MPVEYRGYLVTPLGRLQLTSRDGYLAAVVIPAAADSAPAADPPAVPADATGCPILAQAAQQLEEYFAGRRREFALPLALPTGPPFTRRVCDLLCQVPYAATLTYGQLAVQAGSPGAARAVGQVMAANPLPIVVPCHRVIAANGGLGGYSGGGGLCTKAWLLAFEKDNLLSS
jgi:methylated-DNA-[protein]-cysteine S-methyltransferase